MRKQLELTCSTIIYSDSNLKEMWQHKRKESPLSHLRCYFFWPVMVWRGRAALVRPARFDGTYGKYKGKCKQCAMLCLARFLFMPNNAKSQALGRFRSDNIDQVFQVLAFMDGSTLQMGQFLFLGRPLSLERSKTLNTVCTIVTEPKEDPTAA